MKVICTIVFNVRFCRKYYLYIFDCICVSQGPVINIAMGERGGGGECEKPPILYFFS